MNRADTKILLLENIHPVARDMLTADGYNVELIATALKEEELKARLAGVSILGIRSKTRVTEKVHAAADKLLAVGCFCIGTNQVDLANANRRGVPVFNAPFSNTRSVAELIIAEIISLARQLGESIPPKFRPLANRTNIVVTRQEDYDAPGCLVVNSIPAAIDIAIDNHEGEVFITGEEAHGLVKKG